MPDAFDSRDSESMARALVAALDHIRASGFLNGDTEADVRTSLAHMILAECGRGERDEGKLVAYAVARYRQSRGAGETPVK